jgi:hypothetical protein
MAKPVASHKVGSTCDCASAPGEQMNGSRGPQAEGADRLPGAHLRDLQQPAVAPGQSNLPQWLARRRQRLARPSRRQAVGANPLAGFSFRSAHRQRRSRVGRGDRFTCDATWFWMRWVTTMASTPLATMSLWLGKLVIFRSIFRALVLRARVVCCYGRSGYCNGRNPSERTIRHDPIKL